jgi:hypothetical protein
MLGYENDKAEERSAKMEITNSSAKLGGEMANLEDMNRTMMENDFRVDSPPSPIPTSIAEKTSRH